MRVSVEPGDVSAILHLRGEFDIFYCPILQKEVEELSAAGIHHVVLNLSNVTFINSTALGAILRAFKYMEANEGSLVISSPSSFCESIMLGLGLERVIPIHPTDEQAEASLHDLTPEMDDRNLILFHPTDHSLVESFVPAGDRFSGVELIQDAGDNSWVGVGSMSGIDAHGLRFRWRPGDSSLELGDMRRMLQPGTELDVRFRLPISVGGTCKAVVRVERVEERSRDLRISASFLTVDPDKETAVRRHVAELASLKGELGVPGVSGAPPGTPPRP